MMREELAALQVAVFVMCGGGVLGEMAAKQPAGFYVPRGCGRLPYGKRKIAQVVKRLATRAREAGLDPENMPPVQTLHNCGIW